MGPQCIQIRVMPDPTAPLRSSPRERTLEQVERLFLIAQTAVDTGDVVLNKNVVGVNRQSAGRPLTCSGVIAHGEKGARAKIHGPRIVEFERKLSLGSFKALLFSGVFTALWLISAAFFRLASTLIS